MFHCNGREPSSYYYNIILQVKLEIYEFDQIVYEVADLCTSCEVGLIVYLFNCIFACFVQLSFFNAYNICNVCLHSMLQTCNVLSALI